MKTLRGILITASLLTVSVLLQAQQLDVTVTDVGGNKIQLVGTATGAGFAAAPNNAWTSMNLTWRIPKSAVQPPAPTVFAPSATPQVTGENTAFTGAAPRDGFTHGLDLAIFDVTTFGGPDDGYWYFQVTGTTGTVQNIAAGGTVLLYEFTVPWQWKCPACVEVLTTDVPDLMTWAGISTTSFIDNAGLGLDVLNLVTNMAYLPVEWLYVKAAAKDNKLIEVTWATASEQDNAGYTVERSEDGGSTYHAIAVVPAHGNTTLPSYYSVNDAQVVAGIKYYYRIKQTDLDHRVRYSVIVAGMLTGGNYFTVQVKPNPVNNVLTLEIQSAKRQSVQVIITDITGRLYKKDGVVETATVATRYTYNVAGFPAGMYVAQVIAEDGTVESVKFMIRR
jgi:hypothetical protein